MKARDLKVGMEVAEVPCSWDPNGEPERLVVMDIGNYTTYRFGGKEVTLTATTDSGEVVTSTSRSLIHKSPGARKAHVIVASQLRHAAAGPRWRLVEMALSRIEGPYSEVKEARAQQRVEDKARNERAKSDRDGVANRVNEAIQRLEALGYGSRVNTHSPERNEVVLKIKVVEAMLDHLEGREPS